MNAMKDGALISSLCRAANSPKTILQKCFFLHKRFIYPESDTPRSVQNTRYVDALNFSLNSCMIHAKFLTQSFSTWLCQM